MAPICYRDGFIQQQIQKRHPNSDRHVWRRGRSGTKQRLRLAYEPHSSQLV